MPQAAEDIFSCKKEDECLESESVPNKDPASHSFCQVPGPWKMLEKTTTEKPPFASDQDGVHNGPLMLVGTQSKHQEGQDDGGILNVVTECNDTDCLVAEGRICQDTPVETEGDLHNRSVVGVVTTTSCQHPSNAPPRPLKSGLLVIPDEPQTDLQIKSNPELERTDYLGNSNEFPRKEKERWFVTMDIGQTRSRENVGTSGKKKKRKKRHSRSQSELGLGCGDWDPAIQSGSEAERCGDAEPRGQELPWELEGFQSRGETAVCTGETRHQFHSLWAIWQPSKPTLLSPDPTFKETTRSVSHRGLEDSCEAEVESRHTLQTSSEQETPGEKLCQNKDHFWADELTYNMADGKSIHGKFPLKVSCNRGSVESGQKDPNILNLSIPSCDKILDYALIKQIDILSGDAQQKMTFPTQRHHSDRRAITQIPLARMNSKYPDTDSSKKYVEHHSDTQQTPHTGANLLAQKQTNNVLESSCKFIPPGNKQIFTSDTETFDPPSSALSASEDTQPPTVVSKNVCVVVRDYLDGLLPQGQQSTTQQPDLTTVLPGTSDLECLNEIRTETDHVFQDGVVLSSGRKEKIHREDEQVMKTEELTQASSMQNLDIQKNLPPLTDPEDKELQDFSGKGKVAGDTSPAVGPASTLTTTECCVSQEPLTLNPTYPVYAISSFWDEMEKLTIKDILHLRLVSHVQSPRDLPYNLTADPSDAADSDYFTLLDESKPDHPSSEFSTSSDFEEDFLQEINTSTDPSPEPPDKKHQEHSSARLPSSKAILWDSDLALKTRHQEGFREKEVFCSEYTSQSHLSEFSVSDQGPLHPVQSERENSCLYFLSHQESEQQFRSEPVEHTESVGKTCPTLFDSDMLTDSFNIPFSEIFKCSLGENEATFSPLDTSAAVCLTDENAQKLSVPEMYDYFFAEFETGSLFFPLSQRCDGNKMVPIFSCSRSAEQSFQTTQTYNCFLPENSVRSDDEDDCKPVRVVTRANSRVNEPEEAVAAPDTYEQFCTDSDWKGNVFWRNPFSLRGTRFLLGGFLQPRGSSISWECPSLRGWGYLLFRRIRLGSQGDHNCHPRIGYLDKQTFTQEKEAQQPNPGMQTSLCIQAGLENLLLSLQHADLCLVCIAFASWLLKSVNPQDADTWRTILLANVSAFSAIRYLRHSTCDSAPDHEL
ncbi:PGC-1 and ERR-induced regulator in muscle protein 1 isoform X1 [Arapaima gigas]